MISIIVPTCSRVSECGKLVSHLAQARCVEIIVIENGSSLEQKIQYSKLFSSFSDNIKLVFSFEKGASNARNFGASIASYEWVWFIDDDDFVSTKTICDCLRFLRDDIDVIILPFTLSSNGGQVYRYCPTVATYKHIRRHGHIGNANILVLSKAFFFRSGGWDGELRCGQDTDLFLRIFKYNPVVYFLETVPVEIFDDYRDRITLNTKVQMVGKAAFMKKHWRNLHPLRLAKYAVSFGIAWPVLKKIYFKIRNEFMAFSKA